MNASRGEIKIREILEDAGLRFTMEQSFEGLNSSNGRPLRFDFCIFESVGSKNARPPDEVSQKR